MTEVLRAFAVLCICNAALPTLAQEATVAEAKSLVRVVLKHQKVQLSSRYCEVERLDKNGRAFVSEYYSFGAHCDYPDTAATTAFGIYVVNPRTGDVWRKIPIFTH
jgi:hypothetical protein